MALLLRQCNKPLYMKAYIPKWFHGLIDYAYVPLVWAAPRLLNFKEERTADKTCKAISAAVLGYTLTTDAPWSPVKALPYKKHLLLDEGLSVAAVAAPFVFGFQKNERARNTLIGIGLLGLVVTVLSKARK